MLIVAAVASWNVVATIQHVRPPPVPVPGAPVDWPTAQERRFAALARELGRRGIGGTVGYFTDVAEDRLPGEPTPVERYYLAQYVLVPRVLASHAAGSDWAVGNFRSGLSAPPAGWRVEHDFGDGVLLLRRAAP